MSRRKQGRPQQRLTLDSVEQENDHLVCGDCQTNFPLEDITKFIHHKVIKCNKEIENCSIQNETDCNSDSEDENITISTKQTPISAPITRKEPVDGATKSSHNTLSEIKVDNCSSFESDVEDIKEQLPFQLRHMADANTNTTYSEPLKFTCETCWKTLSSAWNLLQHAQREHGMRIYVTSFQDSYMPSQSPHVTNSLTVEKSEDFSKDIIKVENERHDKEDFNIKERIPSEPSENRHGTSSVGSASSCEGPLSNHQSPHNPFMFPRMPFSDVRYPPSPLTGLCTTELGLHDFGGDSVSSRGMYMMGFEKSPLAPFHQFERPGPGTSKDDFYSQRLRQLASSTSPSPGRKQPFQHSQSPPSGSGPTHPWSSITPPGITEPVQVDIEKTGTENSRSLTPFGNQKSCEFCGKTFHFQSNLIVHRRSHTGEKPFKCPLCPHACTQQSKLKRHMKTHAKQNRCSSEGAMSNTLESNHMSNNSTPDSNKMINEEDDEDEEEIDNEEMEPVENEKKDKEKTNKGQKKIFGHSELAARLFNQTIEPTIQQELLRHSENIDQKELSLSEVIENTGLRSLPNYNEALHLAIAGKYSEFSNDGQLKSMSHQDGSPHIQISHDLHDPERGQKRDKSLDDSDMNLVPKILKMEKEDKVSIYPVASASRINSPMDAYYTSIWLTSPDFASRFTLPPSLSGTDVPLKSFGLSTSSKSSFDTLTSTATVSPSTPLLTNGSTQATASRKDRSHNDTCEFCGKVFKNCSNLTVHRRSHTGEKPYKCMLCKYACAQSSKLTRHMKTHGSFGKDVYKCKFCSTPFSVPSTLEKHMRKCVANACRVSLPYDEESRSSDAASMSDSQLSAPSVSLPGTPLSLSAPLVLPMQYSLANCDKNMCQATESRGETGSDSHQMPSSETTSSSSFPNNFNVSQPLSSTQQVSLLSNDARVSQSEDSPSSEKSKNPIVHMKSDEISEGSSVMSITKNIKQEPIDGMDSPPCSSTLRFNNLYDSAVNSFI